MQETKVKVTRVRGAKYFNEASYINDYTRQRINEAIQSIVRVEREAEPRTKGEILQRISLEIPPYIGEESTPALAIVCYMGEIRNVIREVL